MAELRAALAAAIDAVTVASAELDGHPLHPQRVASRVFDVALPEDNLFDPACPDPGVPAGVYGPAVDEGLYVRLPPLSPGNHELHIQAEVPALSFSLDVRYHLTIVPAHH